MTPTLHKYLSKDLIITTVLAAAAFTMIMTTLAVFEPLRKQGLQASQALQLFWYMLPVMLSFTLPIAAVFGATFTYGRFAMDNELTACRASGLSTYVLLKPAIVLGVAVGVSTLLLGNWIAPKLARLGEETVKANLRGLVYQKLRSEGQVQFGSLMLHADSVDQASNQLHGVVVVDDDSSDNVSFYTAEVALVEITEQDDHTEVQVFAIHPTHGEQQGFMLHEFGQLSFGPFPLGGSFRDKPSFYDWGKLQEILTNPRKSLEVERQLEYIRRRLLAADLYDEMIAALAAGDVYELVRDGEYRYAFTAPSAEVDSAGKRLMLSGGADADPDARPVIVTVYRGEQRHRRYECHRVEVEMTPPRDEAWARSGQSDSTGGDASKAWISVTLMDLIMHREDVPNSEPIRKKRLPLGQLQMPADMGSRGNSRVDLEDLYGNYDDERFKSVRKYSTALHDFIRNRLHPRIIAEIHGRLAYGIGCVLLVPIGAALGLIYRGGHILSAFALCCIPAMTLVVLMIMGKQMIANPDVEIWVGKTAVWSGVAILTVLTAYLYGVSLKR